MALSELLVDAALVALAVLALGFALSGLALCIRPDDRNKPQENPPAASLLAPLETPWRIERIVYRHHRWFGSLVVLATSLSLWRLAHAEVLWRPTLVGFPTPLVWLLVILTTLALLSGLVIFLRPSSLKPVEARANRWIAWQGSGLQRWIARHPRFRGLLVLVVSAYALAVFGTLLAQRIPGWFPGPG